MPRLLRLAGDKHLSLMGPFVSDSENQWLFYFFVSRPSFALTFLATKSSTSGPLQEGKPQYNDLLTKISCFVNNKNKASE
jgi:hypothetical protein